MAEVRVDRGLTQEQLAERVEIAVRYLQAVEAGRQNVTIGTVAHLAAALRVAPEELFKPPAPGPPGRAGRGAPAAPATTDRARPRAPARKRER